MFVGSGVRLALDRYGVKRRPRRFVDGCPPQPHERTLQTRSRLRAKFRKSAIVPSALQLSPALAAE
jgi:hypothetical protein